MSKKKILFVTHEMTPYLEGTVMSEMARALPQDMQEKGFEVRVFMPRFGMIKERKHRLHEVIRLSGINIAVGEDDNPLLIKVASLPSAKMQIYFLDNEDFFKHRGIFHAENGSFYPDNDERVIFFNKGVIEIILKLGWIPDIIHCHGWMTGLVPLYARTVSRHEPVFRNTKFIYTVYDSPFEHTLGKSFVNKAIVNGQSPEHFSKLKNPDCNDLYCAGATFADGITIGSSQVNAEVLRHIESLDKPVLPLLKPDTENLGETYYDFYQSLEEQTVLQEGV